MSEYHTPVLLNESVSALIGPTGGVYADATFGGGGHSAEILSRLSERGRLIAFDRDSEATEGCSKEVREDKRLIFVHDNFRFIHNYALWYAQMEKKEAAGRGGRDGGADERGESEGRIEGRGEESGEGRGEGGVLNGILADLGVSSHQFDTAERGFSFRFDAPLDMRMDQQRQSLTAADVLATYSEEQLSSVLALYGEVEGARKMANLIVKARGCGQIATTVQLNAAIEPMLPKFAEHKMLAKVYQALRIEVNGEMRNLEKFLYGAAESLLPGGRLVVITYHSLEDRMVKNFIRTGNISGQVQKDLYGNVTAPLRAAIRKPIVPQESEIAANTRARSAKLRVAEKI